MTGGIYLLLGSNLGDKKQHLVSARSLLSQHAGTITTESCIYETAAWGKNNQDSFFNQVLKINTFLEPKALLTTINRIENDLGRIRQEKWGERIIDIDILYFNTLLMEEPNLVIPHPQIPNRRFTLVPLCEIAPGFVHPGYKRTNAQLLHACPDRLPVELLR